MSSTLYIFSMRFSQSVDPSRFEYVKDGLIQAYLRHIQINLNQHLAKLILKKCIKSG